MAVKKAAPRDKYFSHVGQAEKLLPLTQNGVWVITADGFVDGSHDLSLHHNVCRKKMFIP